MRSWIGAAAMLAVAGCKLEEPPPSDGGQFGEEGFQCDPVGATPLALDEPSPYGITPQELLDLAVGTHAPSLAWLQLGGSTGLTITVARLDGGAVEFVDYENTSDSGTEMACADQLEIEVVVDFVSDDGAFAEHWTGRLVSAFGDDARFGQDLDAVAGTFDAWDHAPEGNDYDEMRAWVTIDFVDGVDGTVTGQGTGSSGDPGDPESPVFAENVDIATFSAAGE